MKHKFERVLIKKCKSHFCLTYKSKDQSSGLSYLVNMTHPVDTQQQCCLNKPIWNQIHGKKTMLGPPESALEQMKLALQAIIAGSTLSRNKDRLFVNISRLVFVTQFIKSRFPTSYINHLILTTICFVKIFMILQQSELFKMFPILRRT